MQQFFLTYRTYLLPFVLGVLLLFAYTKPAKQDTKTSAHLIENYLIDSHNEFEKITNSNLDYQKSILNKTKIKLFIFDKYDSLLLYNDNSIFPPNDPVEYQPEATFSKLNNGWYMQLKRRTIEGNIAVGLVLVKREFHFENKFLENSYDGVKIPSNHNISDVAIRGSIPIHTRNGKVLFSLYADDSRSDSRANLSLVLVYLFIFLICCYYLNVLARKLGARLRPLSGFLFLTVIVAISRYLLIYFKFPAEFHKLDLFNPAIYGSALFAESLGDLVLSCGMLFWVFAYYYGIDNRFKLSIFPVAYRRAEQVFLIAIHLMVSGAILWLFKSIIMDSLISFEVYNVLSLDQYSLLGLICITLLLICHFLLSINVFRRLIDLDIKLPFLMVISAALVLVFSFFIYDTRFEKANIFTAIWCIIFHAIAYRVFCQNRDLRSTQNILIFILLYSILSMFLIENIYEIKERNKREFVANKLLSDHDYVAEFTYDDIAQRIGEDRVVKNYFLHFLANFRNVQDRVSSLYFSGYFSKYNISVYAYDTLGISLDEKDSVSYPYFQDLVRSNRLKGYEPELIYLNDSIANSSYLGIIPIVNNYHVSGILVLLFTPKIYNGQSIYPELLLGKNVSSSIDNSLYDFAIYHKDKLVFQRGDFPYSYYWDKKLNVKPGEHRFIEADNWEHLVCRYPHDKRIIISIQQEGFFEPLATVSYFFVIYFLITVCILGLLSAFQLLRTNRSIMEELTISFRARINYSMLTIIIISFIVIGVMTISFFRTQYDNFYTDRLQRKEKAILTSIEYYLQENYEFLKPDRAAKNSMGEILGLELVKISEIHNIDVNVYDVQGDLATSSQLSIFDNGLISKKMNPVAYQKLAVSNETQFTQVEQVGKLNYTSTYAPIRNKAGTTVAYLNVPYFEKSKTINDEVSSFLITLMNAYVFLLLCAAVLAYFISNSITRPLRFISEKLRILNLNKKNEPIQWKSKDEVGSLISEYNKMIAQLERSANMLAKSERESAWREMARQIAHEIKNPLTPMKLSIQYLQRSINEGNPNVAELAKKVNKTLIEQIDNLSAIAASFSTFAQMPKSQNEAVDLNDILRGVVSLFEKVDEVVIEFSTYKENALVYADKNQLISVFNNLIKNAVQSVEEDKVARINVITLEEYGYIKTVIMDNGVGIPINAYEKVFTPNFTTKSSGTGLGLAIVKQMVEGAKGEIWFESEVGSGTSFYVILPYYNPAV